jgi:hypothetical protein
VKGDRLYLKHILDAIEKVDSYTSVGRQTFITTSHWQDAVIRNSKLSARQPKDYPSSSARGIPISLGVVSPDCETC